MIYGCFGNLQSYEAIELLGFDSIELDLCEINRLPEAEYHEWNGKITSMRCKPHAVSRVIPLDERIAEESFDTAFWLDFFHRGAERTRRWGAEMWVFGGGKPRCLPEEEPRRSRIQHKVDRFILDTADLLQKYGISLVIEPLGAPYSNYIGTVAEAAAFLEEYRHPNITAMCDLRHMVSRKEPLQNIITYAGLIRHAHIDYPLGSQRNFPQKEDGFHYKGYLDALCKAGYDRILTIEATHWNDFPPEATKSLKFLKETF